MRREFLGSYTLRFEPCEALRDRRSGRRGMVAGTDIPGTTWEGESPRRPHRERSTEGGLSSGLVVDTKLRLERGRNKRAPKAKRSKRT